MSLVLLLVRPSIGLYVLVFMKTRRRTSFDSFLYWEKNEKLVVLTEGFELEADRERTL
ncbi:MAG: hypothetical protein QXS62_04565 [Sulfolobales archaeon]